MKKLLYITANPKHENLSVCKTVGREFVRRFLDRNREYDIEELDLYSMDIPEVSPRIITGRGGLVTGEDYNQLSDHEKYLVGRIESLCDQFINADCYVIAAPMWSLNFPPRLKQYLDCIIINNKLIRISDNEVEGLLGDKFRCMVYIQSSGGVYPNFPDGLFNHGVDYFHDVFTFLGVKKFYKILVQGVDDDKIGRHKALEKAYDDIGSVLHKISRATGRGCNI